jgi:hypothetical protein
MEDINVNIVIVALAVVAILIFAIWKFRFVIRIPGFSVAAKPVQDVVVGEKLKATGAEIESVTGAKGATEGGVRLLNEADVSFGKIGPITGVDLTQSQTGESNAAVPTPGRPKGSDDE